MKDIKTIPLTIDSRHCKYNRLTLQKYFVNLMHILFTGIGLYFDMAYLLFIHILTVKIVNSLNMTNYYDTSKVISVITQIISGVLYHQQFLLIRKHSD